MRSLSTVEAARDLAGRGLRALRSFVATFKIDLPGMSIEVDPEPGTADSGALERDLPDLFLAVGRAAEAAGRGWLLLVDEVQYLGEADLSALIVALHRTNQMGLPIVFVGAGLPQVARLAGDAKSYAERLFHFPEIGALDPAQSAEAILKPVEAEGAAIEPAALAVIVEGTRGYPFYLQAWGSEAWDAAERAPITEADARRAGRSAVAQLDQGFFKVRTDRLTRGEMEFVRAMAAIGDGPYAIGDVARALGKEQKALGPPRANIIRKGMIYSTGHGLLDFTVPLFAEHLRRQ
jgi:hypothetical protein